MLDIEVSLILITFVSFIGLIFILNKLLYQPIIGFMDKRSRSLSGDVEGADANLASVARAQEEADSVIRDAKLKAEAIRQEAVDFALKNQEKEIANLRSSLESEYQKFTESLEEEGKTWLSMAKANVDTLKAKLDSKLQGQQ